MTRDEKWLLEEKYGGIATADYEADCARLTAGEPLAYIIGTIPFLGLTISLDSHPLIPRPETEWWTEQMLVQFQPKVAPSRMDAEKRVSQADEPRVGDFSAGKYTALFEVTSDLAHPLCLDLCAGSGAIGCAMLSKLPEAQVYFGEIDPTHELTIQKNIRQNHLDEARAEIRIGDLFAPFGDMRFDLIAINPPYIPEARTLPESVTNYEPAQALFSGPDGLELIRRIAAELGEHLTETGVAWIECDSAHADVAVALFTEAGFATHLCNDQYDKPRVLVVHPAR